jgi:hypothetical protein
MSTPRTGATNDRGRGVPHEDERRETVGAVEHYTCGLVGLLATTVCVVLLYPALVSATRPLHLLSSVALVFIVVTAWVLVWLSFEVVWEWRAGRLTTG